MKQKKIRPSSPSSRVLCARVVFHRTRIPRHVDPQRGFGVSKPVQVPQTVSYAILRLLQRGPSYCKQRTYGVLFLAYRLQVLSRSGIFLFWSEVQGCRATGRGPQNKELVPVSR
jgi:hypothetical protein